MHVNTRKSPNAKGWAFTEKPLLTHTPQAAFYVIKHAEANHRARVRADVSHSQRLNNHKPDLTSRNARSRPLWDRRAPGSQSSLWAASCRLSAPP